MPLCVAVDLTVFDAQVARHVSNGHWRTVEFYKPRSGPVVAVLLVRYPTTIRRLIIPVVVDPVELQVFAPAFVHVVKERLEVVPPSRANLDPPSPIVAEAVVFGIGAPRAHVAPNDIKRVLPKPVARIALGRDLFVKTATTLCVAAA